jgi:hypothetical protein
VAQVTGAISAGAAKCPSHVSASPEHCQSAKCPLRVAASPASYWASRSWLPLDSTAAVHLKFRPWWGTAISASAARPVNWNRAASSEHPCIFLLFSFVIQLKRSGGFSVLSSTLAFCSSALLRRESPVEGQWRREGWESSWAASFTNSGPAIVSCAFQAQTVEPDEGFQGQLLAVLVI